MRLEQAGLGDRFERVLSVDAVQRYKPAREAYRYAARELGVNVRRREPSPEAVACPGAMASDEQRKRETDRQFREEALRWLPDVTHFALSLARNETDADDLVQETFLRAYRAWDQYVPGTECRGWLFTICRHAFLRERRRERRQVVSDDPGLEALAAAAVHASAEQSGHGDLFARIDVAEAVGRALDALPEEFREAVILVDLQDQPYRTAADVLGVPLGTVRSRLFRGRRLLQEILIAYARDAGLAHAGRTPSQADDSPPAEHR